MNDLSKILYLIDLLGGLGSLFMFLTVVSIVVSGAAGIATLFLYTQIYEEKKSKQPDIEAGLIMFGFFKRVFTTFFALFFLSAVIVVFVPEKNTMYMILASEMGETVITNPEVKELFGQVQNYLQDNIAREFGGSQTNSGR